MSAQAALLAYARQLDRQTELTKAILEGRGPADPVAKLIHGETVLRAKMASATGALGRAA